MADVTLSIPNFEAMSDDEVRHHPLARWRDGRWSALSEALCEHYGTSSLNINDAWAYTPMAWSCPACARPKIEIARKTAKNVILCQLEHHHDHLGDLALKVLRERGCRDVPDEVLTERKRACAAALPLIERFAETLVCMDCNAADAAMKAELGRVVVHRDFSFSPSEIGSFIIAAPGLPHRLDVERGRAVWEKAGADFRLRLTFAERLGERLNAGRHDREVTSQPAFGRGDEDAGLFLALAREQLGARGNLPRLGAELLARSCATDGHRSGQAQPRAAQLRIPTRAEFAAHDKVMQGPGPWRTVGPNWLCVCCSRSKIEIMRLSGKGKWTARVHAIHDYEEERDPLALSLRSIYRRDSPVFRQFLTVMVCQDCRLLLTDAARVRGGVVGNETALAPNTVASLVGQGVPHRRHEVAEVALLQAIEQDRIWVEAAKDFWKHREHASAVTLRLYQLTEGRGMAVDKARAHAIAELVASGQLPPDNPDRIFDWLHEEHSRLRC